MNIPRFLLSGLFAAAIGLLVVAAQSIPPAPSAAVGDANEQKVGESKRQKPENDQEPAKTIAPVNQQVGTLSTKHESQQQHSECFVESFFSWIGRWDSNRTIAVFTIVLAVVAGIQAFVYWQQWDVMNDTKERSLRAYVSIRMNNISPFYAAKSPVFFFEWINHGQTPAKDVEFDAVMGVTIENPQDLPAIGGKMNPKRMDLFPNSQATNEQRSEIPCDCGRFFTAEEIGQIRAQTNFIFIGVRIQYWDVFNRGHETQTYYLVRGNRNGLLGLTAEPGTLIEIGNEKPQIGFTIIPGTSKFT